MPRAGLTPALVIAGAADLADEVGFDRLTLAALAARFGVAVPSLYKHVDGLEAVRRGVAIAALGELGAALAAGQAAAAEAPPAERLRVLAHAYRAFATARPGRYAATVRAAQPDDAEHAAAAGSALHVVLAVLGELGLTGDAAVDAARGLRALLHGFASLEAAGGFGMPRDVDESLDRIVDAYGRALTLSTERAHPGSDVAPPAPG
ncbi:MAG: TetR/AcrR family transcriptional regulator [Chloroflexota bacterium]|nr:MAG: TetR/AcrR family transcriptional regulator [Chloroflexota bacterium]